MVDKHTTSTGASSEGEENKSKDLGPNTSIPLDYEAFFEKLDVKHCGEVTFQDFQEALKDIRHPFSNDANLLNAIFQAFDSNHDSRIDFSDLEKYLTSTDDQILRGFRKIDQDNDGKLNRNDFDYYFRKTLKIQPSKDDLVRLFSAIDSKNDGYITYDEFRTFLLLMPRVGGSRIRTAFNYMIEEIGVSSDGDVTLINQFLNGFGFFLAGGLAGVVSRTCTAPFDRIKVFLIARTDLSSTIMHSRREIARHIEEGASKKVIEELRRQASAAEVAKRTQEHHKTIRSPIVQAIRTLWKQGGLKAFYVGNGLNVLKVFPESAIKFGTFEATKRFFSRIEGIQDTSQLSKVSTYLAGGAGGVVSQIAVYPVDTLKFRVQCSNLNEKLKGNDLLAVMAKELYKEGGLRVFYRGLLAGISGIFPYAALDLGTFTTMKNWLVARECKQKNLKEEEVQLPNYVVLPLGAFSGSFGATVVYAINLLRTRLQAQGTYAHPFRYNGFTDVFLQTTRREGVPGLFKGLVPYLAKVVPAVSISYFVYENLKYFIGLNSRIV